MFSANTKEGNKVSETINNSRTEGTLPKMCKNYSKQPEEADMGVDFSTLGQWAEEMRNGNPTLPSNTVTSKLYRAVTRLGAPPTHTHTHGGIQSCDLLGLEPRDTLAPEMNFKSLH